MKNISNIKIGMMIALSLVVMVVFSVSVSRAIQFVDIKSDASYLADVDRVVKWGVMEGKTKDTFAPNECITRQELATALSRYHQYAETQFVGMRTKAQKVVVEKPKATEFSLARTVKCTLDQREYCIDDKCSDEKKDYSIGINFEEKIISTCNSWDCNRAMFTKLLKDGILTFKKRSPAASGWSMEINVESKAFVEIDKRIKGEFRSIGVCEIVN